MRLSLCRLSWFPSSLSRRISLSSDLIGEASGVSGSEGRGTKERTQSSNGVTAPNGASRHGGTDSLTTGVL